MEDLGGTTDPLFKDLNLIIWKDVYPKKTRKNLLELSLGDINTTDRLQRKMTYFFLSSSWCIMCKSKDEYPSHLFAHC